MKKWLRQVALSASELITEPFEERGGILEGFFRRDLTNNQNLEGGAEERELKKVLLSFFS